MKKLTRVVGGEGLEAFDHRRRDGKSKGLASCSFLDEKFQECSKKEVALDTSVETLAVDLRTRTRQLGAKEKARRKKCDVKFSLWRKNVAVVQSSSPTSKLFTS